MNGLLVAFGDGYYGVESNCSEPLFVDDPLQLPMNDSFETSIFPLNYLGDADNNKRVESTVLDDSMGLPMNDFPLSLIEGACDGGESSLSASALDFSKFFEFPTNDSLIIENPSISSHYSADERLESTMDVIQPHFNENSVQNEHTLPKSLGLKEEFPSVEPESELEKFKPTVQKSEKGECIICGKIFIQSLSRHYLTHIEDRAQKVKRNAKMDMNTLERRIRKDVGHGMWEEINRRSATGSRPVSPHCQLLNRLLIIEQRPQRSSGKCIVCGKNLSRDWDYPRHYMTHIQHHGIKRRKAYSVFEFCKKVRNTEKGLEILKEVQKRWNKTYPMHSLNFDNPTIGGS